MALWFTFAKFGFWVLALGFMGVEFGNDCVCFNAAGREAHVMTFEVGAVLEDAKWQAPVYCFDQKAENDNKGGEFSITGASVDGLLRGPFRSVM